MKLKEMLTGIDFDVDVFDDVTDDIYPAFCPPIALTKTGEAEFKDVLDLDVDVYELYSTATISISNLPNYKHLKKCLERLFWSLAGYCSDEDWNKWFYYPDEDQSYEDDVSEVGYNPYMGCNDYDC